MKKTLLYIYRGIVGNETGWAAEGNGQWYYSLALVIDGMLTWWLKPELGVIFTVAAVIHYITICIYGIYGCTMLFDPKARWFSIAYFAIHAIIFIVCTFVNWKWTLLTSLIVIIAYCLAPDCMGENRFIRKYVDTSVRSIATVFIFVFHTILFVTFVVIALSLPISLWTRITIIVICMILHPIIDILEGECISIEDATNDSLQTIKEIIRNHKSRTDSKK